MKRVAAGPTQPPRPAESPPGPTVGRRVRVFARSEALVRPVWYCGIVVATAPRAFKIQMDGLPPAWFLSREEWTYMEPTLGDSKTPKPAEVHAKEVKTGEA
jgi:hypothetical protein